MLYLRQSRQGAHNLWGGYSFTWRDTELTVTGRTPSGRLPLTSAHTIRVEAAPYYEDIYYNPVDIGHTSLRQATPRAHTIHEVAAPQVLHGGRPWGQTCGANQ